MEPDFLLGCLEKPNRCLGDGNIMRMDNNILKRIGQCCILVILLLALQMTTTVITKADDGCSQEYEDCCSCKPQGTLTIPKITCGRIFSDFYCAKPGYIACAKAAFEQYVTCEKAHLDTCNSELNAKIEACRLQADTSANQCADFCSRVGIAHLVWDGTSPIDDCHCQCEIGYGKDGNGCIECEKHCQKESHEDPHYHYDPKASEPDICECKCDDPYIWDEVEDKCFPCPPNSKAVGTSPCVERVKKGCCCNNGYVASLDKSECMHWITDAKKDHTLKTVAFEDNEDGKFAILETPSGSRIKMTVIKQVKTGWANVYSSQSIDPASLEETVVNSVQIEPSTNKYNCGGHVFGGKGGWIFPVEFPRILTEDNNYREVGSANTGRRHSKLL